MAAQYDPNSDYASAYGVMQDRIKRNFAGQRQGLAQELATRGVQSSGVSAIPLGQLGAAEEGQKSDLAGQFALQQANTGIEDRRSAENFSRQMQLGEQGFNMQDALNRRLANQQMQGQIIGGLLGAAGSIGGGYAARSDYALKKNIKAVGKNGPLTVYEFEYKDDMGLELPKGKHIGYMAQEVEKIYPEAVSFKDGYRMVDYGYLAGK